MVLYALHDALVKPMPGEPLAPSLAHSWSESADGLTLEFVICPGVAFHNGDPVTADDVKFSFERYRGASAAMMHARVAAVEAPDPQRVRFRLKQPWSDFLTFYGSATGAGWIVPKGYIMGCQVALARSTRAACRRAGNQPRRDQSGGHRWPLADHR